MDMSTKKDRSIEVGEDCELPILTIIPTTACVMFYIMSYLRRISHFADFPRALRIALLHLALILDSLRTVARCVASLYLLFLYRAPLREKNDVVVRNSRDCDMRSTIITQQPLSLSLALPLFLSRFLRYPLRISKRRKIGSGETAARRERETRTINARHRENMPVRDHRASYRDKTILSAVRRHARTPTL